MPRIDLEKLIARQLEFEVESNALWNAASDDLEDMFRAVEEELYGRRGALLATLETESGALVRNAPNIAVASQVHDEVLVVIKDVVAAVGHEWLEKWINEANKRGNKMGVWALRSFGSLVRNRSVLTAAFENFAELDSLLITSAMQEGYKVLDTYGADIAGYFRKEVVRSIIEGLPLQTPMGSKGDSLVKRLWEGGRIGKGRMRSAAQRAVAIARYELPKIENATYTHKSQELGLNYGININPLDERTTGICEMATQAGAMTYREWIDSYGLPPRAKPFHLCRSQIIWGERSWLK